MSKATCRPPPAFNQPQRGYRFSADAVALAEFAQANRTENVLDLGSGCGVVPILLWQRSPFCWGLGVEVDPELATMARRNVAQFHLEDSILILQADVRFIGPDDLSRFCPRVPSSAFDVITANPPYWPANRGRLNPNLQKAAARHELTLTLEQTLAVTRRFLKPGGRLYLSHLESRQGEVLLGLEQNNLALRRIERVSKLSGRLLFEAHLKVFPRLVPA